MQAIKKTRSVCIQTKFSVCVFQKRCSPIYIAEFNARQKAGFEVDWLDEKQIIDKNLASGNQRDYFRKMEGKRMLLD